MKDTPSDDRVTCMGGCHRGGKPKVYEIVSFNSSGRPQLQGALRALAKRRPEGHHIAALCVQEHQLIGDRLVDQVLHDKARGWRFHASAAKATDGGESAGIAPAL